MSYKIKHWTGKTVNVSEHERGGRKVRPYTKGGSWTTRLGRWIWSWLRTPVLYTLCTVIFASSVASAFFGGELYEYYHPTNIVQAQAALTGNPVVSDEVLRIGMAETRLNQFCDEDAISHGYCKKSEEGEVLMTTNPNKTVDIGKFAINNAAWGAEAVRLGYDIYTEEGNTQMALWIAKNAGVSQWYSSEARWK